MSSFDFKKLKTKSDTRHMTGVVNDPHDWQ